VIIVDKGRNLSCSAIPVTDWRGGTNEEGEGKARHGKNFRLNMLGMTLLFIIPAGWKRGSLLFLLTPHFSRLLKRKVRWMPDDDYRDKPGWDGYLHSVSRPNGIVPGGER
jgi:hypothetical protein